MIYHLRRAFLGTCLVGQWLRLHAPSVGAQGSIPGQGTKSCMLQLRPGTVKKKKKRRRRAFLIARDPFSYPFTPTIRG